MKIRLVLNPELLSNPDAELRYIIPEKVEEYTSHEIREDGYDYDDNKRMLIFLETESWSSESALAAVVTVCKDLGLEAEAIEIAVNV